MKSNFVLNLFIFSWIISSLLYILSESNSFSFLLSLYLSYIFLFISSYSFFLLLYFNLIGLFLFIHKSSSLVFFGSFKFKWFIIWFVLFILKFKFALLFLEFIFLLKFVFVLLINEFRFLNFWNNWASPNPISINFLWVFAFVSKSSFSSIKEKSFPFFSSSLILKLLSCLLKNPLLKLFESLILFL